MDFKKISSDAYNNWLNVMCEKANNKIPLIPDNKISESDKETKDLVTDSQYIIQFAKEISLETIKEYHRQLKKELRSKGISID